MAKIQDLAKYLSAKHKIQQKEAGALPDGSC